MELLLRSDTPPNPISSGALLGYHPDSIAAWGDALAWRIQEAGKKANKNDLADLRIIANYLVFGTKDKNFPKTEKTRVLQEWYPLLGMKKSPEPQTYKAIVQVGANARDAMRNKLS